LIRFISLSPCQRVGILAVPGTQQWLLGIGNGPIILPRAGRGNSA
jgi:hypothetical protein